MTRMASTTAVKQDEGKQVKPKETKVASDADSAMSIQSGHG